MMRRLFSDQYLAANAYRKAWGLLLLAESQREFIQQVRQRLPAKIKVVQMVLAVGMVLLVGCALIATQLFAISGATTATAVFACLLAVSQAITGLRYLQHQMPYTPVLIVGIAALIGLFALLGGAGVWLAVATAAVPIIANGLYRLRWTLRP
jgi:hypothetical protein